MEELDLLKRDWKKNEHAFSQLSETEIYKMLHKKSSSIVKWIMIISVLELILWTVVGLLGNTDDFLANIGQDWVTVFFKTLNVFHYIVIVVLIYLFYKNYVRISTTASTKDLMHDILRTRKTVKFYVWYNLVMMALSLIVGFAINLKYNPEIHQMLEKFNENTGFMAGVMFGMAICMIVIVGLFWLFYRLLYGILLRRLLSNYKELKKIDL
ncbi:MAG TPA: hypothetical protein VF676_04375 [Flavobacterium sp.]|jgi:hypothetical protein